MVMVALAAAAVIGVVAAGVGTWQAVEARQAQAKEAEAVRQEKEKEALLAQQKAQEEERQHRRRIELIMGKQQAITAASGTSLLSGSALAADIDLASEGEMEALNIRRGGTVESQARMFEARLAKFRRDQAKGQIKYEIAQGVLSAASSVTSAYGSYATSQQGGSGYRRGASYGDDYSSTYGRGSVAGRWYYGRR